MIKIYNKKAKFDFEFIKQFNAGIILNGVEAKHIRSNNDVSFNGAYCYIQNNEVYITGLSIGSSVKYKLLLKKREIKRLSNELIKGTTIVPYCLFESNNGRFKLEIYIAKGRKLYDKRRIDKYQV